MEKLQSTSYNHSRRYCLPYDCRIPDLTSLADRNIIPHLQSLAWQFRTAYLKLLSHKILLPSEISELLGCLFYHTNQLASSPDIFPDGSKIHINPFFEENSDNKDVFVIYDHYMNILRYDYADPSIFVKELVLIVRQQIEDIRKMHVSLHEFTAFIAGMSLMFDGLLERTGCVVNPNPSEKPREYDNIDYAAGPTTQEISPLLRWKGGHQTFALMVLFSADEIEKARISFNMNWEKATEHLYRASIFFRASTAIMWVASQFPSQVYLETVRPSMISTEMPNGFSGDQNRDFEYWRFTKNKFIADIKLHWDSIPACLRAAVMQFRSTYIRDGESHILLASEMIGDSASLSQIEAEKAYHFKHKSAAEILRDITRQRIAEFSFTDKSIQS